MEAQPVVFINYPTMTGLGTRLAIALSDFNNSTGQVSGADQAFLIGRGARLLVPALCP